MGGFGSTRWRSTRTRDAIEANRSLNINRLNQAGCLKPDYWGSWQWTRDGERVAWIQLRQDGDLLRLSYRIRQHGGDWQDVEQPTPIVWTPCRFGGSRPYFACPGVVKGIACGRRVLKLYGAGRYFLCRHCYRLAYASQRENRYDRALRRANKIRIRLGGETGTWGAHENRKLIARNYGAVMAVSPDLDNRNRQLGVLRLTDATIAQSFSKN